jgi:hypothetical protein
MKHRFTFFADLSIAQNRLADLSEPPALPRGGPRNNMQDLQFAAFAYQFR